MQRTVDQIVDIPVPGGCLQGTLPEQGSTAVCRDGGLHDSLPDQGSAVFFGVTGLGGDPQGFVPGQSSTAIRRDGGPGGGLQNLSLDRVQ